MVAAAALQHVDVVRHVLLYVSPEEAASCALVSRAWWTAYRTLPQSYWYHAVSAEGECGWYRPFGPHSGQLEDALTVHRHLRRLPCGAGTAWVHGDRAHPLHLSMYRLDFREMFLLHKQSAMLARIVERMSLNILTNYPSYFSTVRGVVLMDTPASVRATASLARKLHEGRGDSMSPPDLAALAAQYTDADQQYQGTLDAGQIPSNDELLSAKDVTCGGVRVDIGFVSATDVVLNLVGLSSGSGSSASLSLSSSGGSSSSLLDQQQPSSPGTAAPAQAQAQAQAQAATPTPPLGATTAQADKDAVIADKDFLISVARLFAHHFHGPKPPPYRVKIRVRRGNDSWRAGVQLVKIHWAELKKLRKRCLALQLQQQQQQQQQPHAQPAPPSPSSFYASLGPRRSFSWNSGSDGALSSHVLPQITEDPPTPTASTGPTSASPSPSAPSSNESSPPLVLDAGLLASPSPPSSQQQQGPPQLGENAPASASPPPRNASTSSRMSRSVRLNPDELAALTQDVQLGRISDNALALTFWWAYGRLRLGSAKAMPWHEETSAASKAHVQTWRRRVELQQRMSCSPSLSLSQSSSANGSTTSLASSDSSSSLQQSPQPQQHNCNPDKADDVPSADELLRSPWQLTPLVPLVTPPRNVNQLEKIFQQWEAAVLKFEQEVDRLAFEAKRGPRVQVEVELYDPHQAQSRAKEQARRQKIDEKTLRKKNKGTAPAPDATTTEPGPAGSVLSEEPEDPAANPIRLLYHGFVNQQGHFVGVYGLYRNATTEALAMEVPGAAFDTEDDLFRPDPYDPRLGDPFEEHDEDGAEDDDWEDRDSDEDDA